MINLTKNEFNLLNKAISIVEKNKKTLSFSINKNENKKVAGGYKYSVHFELDERSDIVFGHDDVTVSVGEEATTICDLPTAQWDQVRKLKLHFYIKEQSFKKEAKKGINESLLNKLSKF